MADVHKNPSLAPGSHSQGSPSAPDMDLYVTDGQYGSTSNVCPFCAAPIESLDANSGTEERQTQSCSRCGANIAFTTAVPMYHEPGAERSVQPATTSTAGGGDVPQATAYVADSVATDATVGLAYYQDTQQLGYAGRNSAPNSGAPARSSASDAVVPRPVRIPVEDMPIGSFPSQCERCGAVVIVPAISNEVGCCTWISASILAFLGCWLCVVAPFCMDSTKDKVYRCPRCRKSLARRKKHLI